MREFMLYGELPQQLNLGFQALFLGLSIAAMLVRRPRLHEAIAGMMVLLLAANIALLFARL